MADFSKNIRLVIDVVTGNAKSGLSSLKSEIDGTEGAWGKLKVAGKGAFDFVAANATTFGIAAGTAVATFAAKAVGHFEDLALGAGKLRDALGLTADQASRWQEVAGDLGISTDSLATAMGRMEKTAGATPQVFEQLGVSIARAKDGTVDANGTFLNVIGALNGMKDPAERAAAAQKLLGKSWQDASELISLGATGVQQRLAGVEKQKIVSDAQIAQARQFRDEMDNLKDSGEDLSLSLGRVLLPAISEIAQDSATAASAAAHLFDVLASAPEKANTPTNRLLGAVGAVLQHLSNAGNPVNEYSRAIGEFASSSDHAADRQQALADAQGNATSSLVQLGAGYKAAADGVDNVAAAAAGAAGAQQAVKDQLDDIAGSADKAKDAANGFAGALDNVFGSATDLQGAQDQVTQGFLDLQETMLRATDNQEGYSLSLSESTQEGLKNREAVRSQAQSIEEYTARLATSGATSEQVQAKYEQMRGQLVTQLTSFGLTRDAAEAYANQLGLTPKNVTTAIQQVGMQDAKSQIIDYVRNHLNSIPASKLTEILAHLQRDEFDAALSLINSLPRSKTVDIVFRQIGSFIGLASGGVAPAGGAIAGENFRPEILNDKFVVSSPTPVPAGTRVTGEAETARRLASGTAGTVINVQATAMDPNQIAAAIALAQWRQNAQPRRAS